MLGVAGGEGDESVVDGEKEGVRVCHSGTQEGVSSTGQVDDIRLFAIHNS